MKPDTSRWRDQNQYEFYDALPVEGADRRTGKRAGVCLRCKAAGERRVRSGMRHPTVASATVGSGSILPVRRTEKPPFALA